jgi:hypothetical protein
MSALYFRFPPKAEVESLACEAESKEIFCILVTDLVAELVFG